MTMVGCRIAANKCNLCNYMFGLKNIATGNQKDSVILFVLSLGQSDFKISNMLIAPAHTSCTSVPSLI